MSEFTIAAAQLSAIRGDITQNVARHVALAEAAASRQVNVIVFPELSLTGYEPSLAAELAIHADSSELHPLQKVADRCDLTVVAGCPLRSAETKPFIGAFIVRPKQPIAVYRKRFLHVDEETHFISYPDVVVCDSHSKTLGIAICADISNPAHPADTVDLGATIYIAGVAITPRGIAKAESSLVKHARRHDLLTVMSNYQSSTCGFEMAGKSGIWDATGNVVAQADSTSECFVMATETADGWIGSVVSFNDAE